MGSYKLNWSPTLHRLANDLRGEILKVLPQRENISNKRFKNLLDSVAQEAIIETLTKLKVSAQLVSEEGDLIIGGCEYIVVADPVDGTTNLSKGFQPAVASISVAEKPYQSNVLAGIVINLYTGKTFYAEKGRGASIDNNIIRVAKPVKYNEGLISMDISKKPHLEKTQSLIMKAQHIRMEGCSAMSLCNVASGVLDAHIDIRGIVRATDISAGLFILKEAGGLYTINNQLYGELSLTKDTRVELIASSSRELLNEIIKLTG